MKRCPDCFNAYGHHPNCPNFDAELEQDENPDWEYDQLRDSGELDERD